jgi:hypothetical protein
MMPSLHTVYFVLGLLLTVGTWGSLLATFVLPRGRSALLRPPVER